MLLKFKIFKAITNEIDFKTLKSNQFSFEVSKHFWIKKIDNYIKSINHD